MKMKTFEDYTKAAQTIQNLTTKLHGSYVSLMRFQTAIAALKNASDHLTASLANNTDTDTNFIAMTQCINLANMIVNPTVMPTNNNYVGKNPSTFRQVWDNGGVFLT